MSRLLHLTATYLKKTVTLFELNFFIAMLVKYNFYLSSSDLSRWTYLTDEGPEVFERDGSGQALPRAHPQPSF